MTLRLPLPTSRTAGFAIVGVILCGWLLLWAYLGGRATGVTHRLSVPAYCNGKAILDCAHELAVSNGAPDNAVVRSCDLVRGRYLCDVRVESFGAVTCYDMTVSRSAHGLPSMDAVSERKTC